MMSSDFTHSVGLTFKNIWQNFSRCGVGSSACGRKGLMSWRMISSHCRIPPTSKMFQVGQHCTPGIPHHVNREAGAFGPTDNLLSSFWQLRRITVGSLSSMANSTSRMCTISYTPAIDSGGSWVASQARRRTFGGRHSACGNWSVERSKPSNCAEEGTYLDNSLSQIPVPVATSAIFKSGFVRSTEG
jgi:hypothetical protein